MQSKSQMRLLQKMFTLLSFRPENKTIVMTVSSIPVHQKSLNLIVVMRKNHSISRSKQKIFVTVRFHDRLPKYALLWIRQTCSMMNLRLFELL